MYAAAPDWIEAEGVYCLGQRAGSREWVHQRCARQNPLGCPLEGLSATDKRKVLRRLITVSADRSCQACGHKGATLCCQRAECHTFYHRKCVPAHVVQSETRFEFFFTCDLPHVAASSDSSATPIASAPRTPPSMSHYAIAAGAAEQVESLTEAAVSHSASASDGPSTAGLLSSSLTTAAYQPNVVVQSVVSLLEELRGILAGHHIAHLDLTYAMQTVGACLDHLKRELGARVKVVVTGANGAGKSTMCNVILHLTAKDEHSYVHDIADRTQGAVYRMEALLDKEAGRLEAVFHEVYRHGKVIARNSQAQSDGVSAPDSVHPMGDGPTDAKREAIAAVDTSVTALMSMRGDAAMVDSNVFDTAFDGDGLAVHAIRDGYHASVGADSAATADDSFHQHVDITVAYVDEDGKQCDTATGCCSPVVVARLTGAGESYLGDEKKKRKFRRHWDQQLQQASEVTIEGGKLSPWLLWSADEGATTTNHIFRVLHGHLWHASISFLPRNLAQQLALSYISRMVQLYTADVSRVEDQLKLAKARYDAVIDLPLSAFDFSNVMSAELASQMVLDDLDHTSQAVQDRRAAAATQRQSDEKVMYTGRPADLPICAVLHPLLGRRVVFQG